MFSKKNIINVILIFMFIMSLGLSIGYNNEIECDNNVANYYFEESVNSQEIENLLVASEYSYTTWKEEKGKDLFQPELEKTYNATVLTINGDSSLLFKGTVLFKEDKKGCLIGEEVAKNLFGGTDVIGNTLKYNDNEYVVRGINKYNKDSLIIEQSYKYDGNVDGVAIDINKNNLKTIEAIGQSFGFGKNTSIPAETIENNFYHSISSIFSSIVLFIILFILVIYIIKTIRRDRKKPVLCLIYLLMIIGVVFIFFKITNLKVSIHYNIIPDKWSNFEYWGDLFEQYSESYKNILFMKKYSFDIYRIEIMIKSIFYSICSIALFCVLSRRIKVKEFNKLIYFIMYVFICAFIVEIKVNNSNCLDLDGLIIWLIYPLYLVGSYLYNTKIISTKLKS